MSGSVMPAQKVAGSMTSAAIAGAGEVEQQIAGVGAREALEQRFHQAEGEVVHRQRRRGGEAHRHLHPGRAGAPARRTVSTRRRTARPPSARPKMKVASISSKECVEAPSTSESMRIQLIS